MGSSGLPRFIVLISKPAQQRCVRVDRDGLLSIRQPEILSPVSKFELERAKTPGKGSLFNIRSCYNNKYWVKESPGSVNIKAAAAEPNEDTSTRSCTLVEVVLVSGTIITLKLAQSNKFIAVSLPDANFDRNLYEAGFSAIDRSEFSVLDWESLVIFPKEVAFKGENGKYLAVRTVENQPHLRFDSDDIGDASVVHEVFGVGNGLGTVTIRAKHTNKYWRRSPSNWIWADSDTDRGSQDLVFEAVKAANNTIALRNLGNRNFCQSYTNRNQVNCLNAATPTITNGAKLIVQEAVLSRTISNVNYRLLDARIYDQSILTMATQDATNGGTETISAELRFLYQEKSSTTWERSVTASLSVATTINAGVPFIVNGEVQITGTIEGSFQWTETKETTKDLESTLTVPVPPRSRVKVSLVATKGRCDVPFSYSVRDVLTNGRVVTYTMDDGVYIGANAFNFRYVTTQDALPPAPVG